jgi:hypothetical protein
MRKGAEMSKPAPLTASLVKKGEAAPATTSPAPTPAPPAHKGKSQEGQRHSWVSSFDMACRLAHWEMAERIKTGRRPTLQELITTAMDEALTKRGF